MKTQVFCLVAVLLASTCQAFWLNSRTTEARSAGRAVEESCLAKARQGSCEFYTCFENRLPCGRSWYILRHGQYYCNKMVQESPQFNQQGQTFLTNVQRCMTMSLKDLYQEDNLNCHSLEHQAVESMTNCFINNTFCSVLDDNIQHFFQIYNFRDLFTRGAGKIWRAFVHLATECGSERFRELTQSTGDMITNAFQGMIRGASNILNGKK